MTTFSGKTVLRSTYSHLLKITKNSNKIDETIDFKALNIRQEKVMIPERWEPYAYSIFIASRELPDCEAERVNSGKDYISKYFFNQSFHSCLWLLFPQLVTSSLLFSTSLPHKFLKNSFQTPSWFSQKCLGLVGWFVLITTVAYFVFVSPWKPCFYLFS